MTSTPQGGDSPEIPPDRPWLVYLLQCADDSLYTGCTNDLPRRLRAHRAGRVKYTRGRLPVEVVHQEVMAGKSAALSREAAIKRWPRKRKLNLLRQRSL